MSEQLPGVTAVTRRIKQLLDREPGLQNIWLRAEISNFKRHSRGHLYFTLKDDKSRLQTVMFAGSAKNLAFSPENGLSVIVRGDISVYEPFGQYQFYAKEMQPDGIGHLYTQFEQLKKKLHTAGWFSDEHKKKIPRIPQRIAVITSPTGAAVRDIVTTLRRRYPPASVTLLPVLVQGPEAAASISRAVRQADQAGFDVIICGRGGGSLEELWAFNEEETAEAFYRCSTPIISAVGHETDTTMTDFTADLRAPTPTAAAELAVPDIHEMRNFILDRHARLVKTVQRRYQHAADQLHRLEQSYAFKYPRRLIEEKTQQLDTAEERLARSLKTRVDLAYQTLDQQRQRLHVRHPAQLLEQKKERLTYIERELLRAAEEQKQRAEKKLELLLSKLELLSPLSLMRKGYSLTYDQHGRLIRHIQEVQEQETITVRVFGGSVSAAVQEIEAKEDPYE
ncbi:exodeoxyribonuclease VII large subunit [Alkalicoccus chagannorensis]|uniref:exodeoxyribonuclease VII large subunit n=1 Tax=Alkalicoccus chagannorensis TaxID=427072 RepID=UPI0003F76955|nr:exodeoxyribonuclease VII large subunit [Alkalicoccus chagannorensis]